MKYLLTLSLMFIYMASIAQTKEELVYPVVPIADECHYAFDDTTSKRVISLKDFQSLDRIWTTFNSCYSMKDDTIYMKEYIIVLIDPIGEVEATFSVSDGYLKNDYQGSIAYMTKNIKPYYTVLITGIKYEKNGALYQIPYFSLTIDSFVVPVMDTCWQIFPIEPSWNTMVTTDKLIELLTDSFGVNICTNEREWVDSLKVDLTIHLAKYHGLLYPENPGHQVYKINSYSDLKPIIEKIRKLENDDIVEVGIRSKKLYIKDGKYQYAYGARFKIGEVQACEFSFDISSPNTSSLWQYFQDVATNKTDKQLCFEDSMGFGVTFQIILSPINGEPVFFHSTSNKLSYTIKQKITRLKSGDKIQIIALMSENPNIVGMLNYRPIEVTIS